MRGISAVEILDAKAESTEPVSNPYTTEIVWGVIEHADRIDDLLSTYAQGWALDRMPAIDRNLLRIGTFELLWADDVPDAVVISEAVTLAKSLSTDDSPTFINGLLGRILEIKPKLALD